MFALRRSPWFLAVLLGIALVSVAPGPVRANIILTIVEDVQPGEHPGVLACLGISGNCVYVPATTNPAMAFNGGVEAAMLQGGSFIAFAFTLQDTSGQSQYASTAFSTGFANSLVIAIVGTAGEPVGTPVSLRVSSVTNVDPGVAQEITNQLNGLEFAPNSDQTVGGFHVGDTFGYWASIGALGNVPIVYQVNLSVQAEDPTPVPTPGTLALLMSASAAFGAFSLRRRWRTYRRAA